MVFEKRYKGTLAAATGTESVLVSYGMTTNVTQNTYKTQLLNECLEDFLTECGVDCYYEKPFLWVDGVPFHFYVTGTNNFFAVAGPFNTAALITTAAGTGAVFSGANYNFTLRLNGYPGRAVNVIYTLYGVTTTFQTAGGIKVIRARHTLSGKEVRAYGLANTSGLYGVGIDENGNPQNIGRNTTYYAPNAGDHTLTLTADDVNNAVGTVPLVRQVSGPFEFEGGFLYPQNVGIQTGAAIALSQIFVTIGGEEYWVAYSAMGVGLIKKPA